MILKKAIDSIYKLSDDDFKLFIDKTREVKYKKGEIILREGQTCKGIFLVKSGLVGLHKIYKDREYYQDFFFENEFATNIISLSAGKPSEEYLVAIENTEALYIQKEVLLKLYDYSSEFKEFGRRLLEMLLANKTKLAFIRSSLPAKDKYEYVLQELPQLIQRLPVQILASYLGVTRETLSRMRKGV